LSALPLKDVFTTIRQLFRCLSSSSVRRDRPNYHSRFLFHADSNSEPGFPSVSEVI
jgi:hypothetical protein